MSLAGAICPRSGAFSRCGAWRRVVVIAGYALALAGLVWSAGCDGCNVEVCACTCAPASSDAREATP
jgi:hypothetical protein